MLRHEISYSPSASVLLRTEIDLTKRDSPPKLVAIFADPVFDETDSRLTRRVGSHQAHAVLPELSLERSLKETRGSRQASSLPRLPFSRVEAQRIYAMAGPGNAMEALGFDANLETARSQDISQYRILHFATHGLLNTEEPMLSGLMFSLFAKDGTPRAGFLSLSDVYNLRLSADLVVLSACQTGLGKYVNGEGVVGLARGFMYAGAPRVLATLWSVDDWATAELMEQFYSALIIDHMKPAAALRMAQTELWRQKKYRSPYFWAPFLLEGAL